MAPSTIRKAIGAVKDQTSISIAKVSSNMAPELEVAIVKATSHDDDPADEKYVREILNMTSYSRGYVSTCVSSVSKRLSKTRDWIVAIKTLMLVHRLMADGDPEFRQEFVYSTRKGCRLLNMSDFRDEAHSGSWDHSAYVRTYALYLDQRLELLLFERRGVEDRGGAGARPGSRPYDYEYGVGYRDEVPGYGGRRSRSFGDMNESRGEGKGVVTPLREMTPERLLEKMSHLQKLLDRFLACRPTGMAKNSRMVLISLYPVLKESFRLYADVCDMLAVLLDRFFDMDYSDCVRAFDAYSCAAKQMDELILLYNWSKDTGVARSSEFPEVQKITGKVLETLDEFVRDRAKRVRSPEKRDAPSASQGTEEEQEPLPDMNEIKALPAPESYIESPPLEAQVKPDKERIRQQQPVQKQVEERGDLVNLKEEGVSADEQGNQLALALFAGEGVGRGDGEWEAFPSSGGEEVTSAWQTPAAESGKADWELALVETASNLGKQKASLGGGFDPLVLNGIYDQGIVRQHTGAELMGGGSASSVVMPGMGGKQVLALPAPDGSTKPVGADPFSASLSVPPPSYVQMADMENKQHLLVQEQLVWQQYGREGMQGQASLRKMGAQAMAHGVPPVGSTGPPPAGYHYSSY